MDAKYSGERWQQARKAALARDRVCQDCGTTDSLHVHHIRKVRTFEDYDDAHDLNNLVVLCQDCHPKWEGRDERPNTLDTDGKLQLSQLVHDLSRETIKRHHDPPGPWLLTELFKKRFFDHRRRCGVCFAKLDRTVSKTEHCSDCGRPPRFWNLYNPYTLENIRDRVENACQRLAAIGIPASETMARAVVEQLWEKDEWHDNGWLDEKLMMTAIYAAIEAVYDPEELSYEYDAICPVPTPINT